MIIAAIIRDFRADNPVVGDGTTRDRIFEPNEATVPWAKAIIEGLSARGYEIVRKGDGNA